ncbi:MAG: hypothetical protein IJL52_03235 [Clostridia bacterium]|nr:hypothetical protein [Clostridia bacterium]
MFIAVTFLPKDAPASRRKQQVQPQLLRVPVPGAFSFYRLTVPGAPCTAGWNAVRKAASLLRLPLLLPKGVAAPPGLPVVCGTAYRSGLLLNGMAKALPALAPAGARITVLDDGGALAQRIAILAPFARALTVVTRRPQNYCAAQSDLMARFGVSLPVYRKAADAVFDCGVLFAPDAAAVPLGYAGLVFTLERQSFLNATVFTCKSVALPAPYDALRPDGTDPNRFAAALVERCRARLPEDLTAEVETMDN